MLSKARDHGGANEGYKASPPEGLRLDGFHAVHAVRNFPPCWVSFTKPIRFVYVLLRNNELTNLRRCDITFGCDGPAPYRQDHIKVTLAQRKGWQHRIDKDPNDDGEFSNTSLALDF